MTLKAIKSAFIALMKTKYPLSAYKYYSMAVVEGYQRPCFFTDIQIDESEPLGRNTYRYRGHFDVELLQKVVDEGQALDCFDTLRNLFGISVKVGDRAIKVLGMDYSYSGTDGNVMMMSVDLEWTDTIAHEAPPGSDVVMETLGYEQKLTIDYEK